MNALKNLKTDESINNEKDSLGVGRVLDSGIYLLKVALAYVIKSTGGALGLVTVMKTEDGRELRQTFWMTSGDAKGNKNYYEKDGVKNYLPGFLQANALALLTLGKEIGDLETEQKVCNVYSFEAKAEVPTKVDMFTDLLGQEIYAAVFKQTVDKNVKNDKGEYVPSGETREENEVDKLFRVKDKMTTAEIRGEATEASFFDKWAEKNSGKTRDRSTKGGGTAGAPKGAAPAGSGGKPTKSLFV